MFTSTQAHQELRLAASLNPGPWEQHSVSVATNARIIAWKAGLDEDKAYVYGLLHDIGRRAGVSGIRHIFDGYDYLRDLGEKEIGRICLTHSFPAKIIDIYPSHNDCSPMQRIFLEHFLSSIEYNDYDLLIQLCDSISLPSGACIMEKRLIDVALRYGCTELTQQKWKAFMEIKKHFDALCGCNIYTLLPNITENSYADLI